MAATSSGKKVILLVIDGLGDLPTPKTALQTAKKPNLDKLARNGCTGLMATVGRGIVPGSDTSHLQLFGYNPETYYLGRGPLEALGVGIDLRHGDVAFRANFATVDSGMNIVDRRAGRIETAIGKQLEQDVNMKIEDVEVIFKSSVEHRGALVLRGKGLSSDVGPTDPHGTGSVLESKPELDTPEAKKTCRILNKFSSEVYRRLKNHPANKGRKLPANMVLLRGAGTFEKVESVYERFGIRAACVAGGALYKGVARYVGMDVLNVKGATGTRSTDLAAKGWAAYEALNGHDFVFVHVKGCDSHGHDGDCKGKASMIERIDKELIPILVKSGAYLVVTGDHSTPCSRKNHSGHEVPILIYGKDERVDKVTKFDEISCMAGGLGHINGKDVMPLILNLLEKGKMYGT
jgi:2,3-bisphosphoglycerate-independent phosphoglycerate mutase